MLRCRKSGVLNLLAGWLWSRAHYYWRLSSSRCMASVIWCAERELQFADPQSNLEQDRILRRRFACVSELAEHRRARCRKCRAGEIRLRYLPAPGAERAGSGTVAYSRLSMAVKSQKWRCNVAGKNRLCPDIYIERDFNAGLLTEQQAQN